MVHNSPPVKPNYCTSLTVNSKTHIESKTQSETIWLTLVYSATFEGNPGLTDDFQSSTTTMANHNIKIHNITHGQLAIYFTSMNYFNYVNCFLNKRTTLWTLPVNWTHMYSNNSYSSSWPGSQNTASSDLDTWVHTPIRQTLLTRLASKIEHSGMLNVL